MSARYIKNESHKFVWHKFVWHKLVLCIINTFHIYCNYSSSLFAGWTSPCISAYRQRCLQLPHCLGREWRRGEWNIPGLTSLPTMERQKITLFQHFFLNLLHFSNTIYPYFLHFSNILMFSFINVVFVTRPRFWYWLTLFSLHICIFRCYADI